MTNKKKHYLVTHREVLITTYRVLATDEEDAFDAIQFGDGEEVEKDTESMPEGEDEWEAVLDQA